MNKIIISLSFLFLLSCSSNQKSHAIAKVFEGTWVDTKKSEIVWKFEAVGGTVKGTRISGDDGFTPDKIAWDISDKGDVLIGISKIKDGASITYFPAKKEILMTPPGILYKKK